MPFILLAILSLLLFYVHQFNLNLEIQPLINSDSYTHYKQLLVMFEGFKHIDPIAFFSFNFNYGFPYFLSNFLVSLPALLSGSHPNMILSVRLFASFWAIIGLIFFYKILRLHLPKAPALILTSSIACMPFFWIVSGWFRADWMMTSLFIISLFYCFKSFEAKPKLEPRYFWTASVFYFLAFSVKTQAIILIPFYLIWIFIRSTPKLKAILEIPKWIAAMIITYIITNPHILHPAGFYGITRRFMLEFAFFTGDHTHGLAKLTFVDKLHYWDTYFTPFFALTIITLYAFIRLTKEWLPNKTWSIKTWWKLQDNTTWPFILVAKLTAINLIYLYLISVVFPWKFLIPVIFMVLLLTVPLLKQWSHKTQIVLTSLFLALVIGTHIHDYPNIFFPENIQNRPSVVAQENYITSTIKPYLYLNSVILTDPYIIIDYKKLNIPHTQIELFWYNPISQLNENAFNQKWAKVSQYKVKRFREKSIVLLRKPISNAIWGQIPKSYRVIGETQEILILAKITHFSS